MNFNPHAIINNPYRMCENRNCNHIREEHPRNTCEKCNCKNFEDNELTISLDYDNCTHSFTNFLERKCPNCKNPTSMIMAGIGDEDPFNTIKLDDKKFGLTLKTALHNCGKCGLISYYNVDISFDHILRDLILKAKLKKREKEA